MSSGKDDATVGPPDPKRHATIVKGDPELLPNIHISLEKQKSAKRKPGKKMTIIKKGGEEAQPSAAGGDEPMTDAGPGGSGSGTQAAMESGGGSSQKPRSLGPGGAPGGGAGSAAAGPGGAAAGGLLGMAGGNPGGRRWGPVNPGARERKPIKGKYLYKQFHVVGRHLPTKDDPTPKLYRMKVWAKDHVKAKSKFWYFLSLLRRVKKGNGQIIACNEIHPKNATVPRNYGVWIRYQSRTGYHNMYKEYRDVTLNGAVEQMYLEMASRHCARHAQIQIIRTAELKPSQCKREHIKQFHDSKIKFPMTSKSVRAPQPHLEKLYAPQMPNVAMW